MENGFTISPKKPPASLVTLENIVGPSASVKAGFNLTHLAG